MNTRKSIRQLTITALLVAMGIIIPMVMPKIVIGPASFTLASHVPLFIAMFFSPGIAIAVALGTAFGFFLSMPLVIALRALSHLVFAVLGALYLQKHPGILSLNGRFSLFNWKFQGFNLIIGLIHSAIEMIMVSVFFFNGSMTEAYYTEGFFYTIFILMGIGGLIHSFIDYNIAYFVGEMLSKTLDVPAFTNAKKAVQEEVMKDVPAA